MWALIALMIVLLCCNNVIMAEKWVKYDALIWYGNASREHDSLSPEQLDKHIAVSTVVVAIFASVVGLAFVWLGLGFAVITSSLWAPLGALALAVFAGYVICLTLAYALYYVASGLFFLCFTLFNK